MAFLFSHTIADFQSFYCCGLLQSKQSSLGAEERCLRCGHCALSHVGSCTVLDRECVQEWCSSSSSTEPGEPGKQFSSNE